MTLKNVSGQQKLKCQCVPQWHFHGTSLYGTSLLGSPYCQAHQNEMATVSALIRPSPRSHVKLTINAAKKGGNHGQPDLLPPPLLWDESTANIKYPKVEKYPKTSSFHDVGLEVLVVLTCFELELNVLLHKPCWPALKRLLPLVVCTQAPASFMVSNKKFSFSPSPASPWDLDLRVFPEAVDWPVPKRRTPLVGCTQAPIH